MGGEEKGGLESKFGRRLFGMATDEANIKPRQFWHLSSCCGSSQSNVTFQSMKKDYVRIPNKEIVDNKRLSGTNKLSARFKYSMTAPNR